MEVQEMKGWVVGSTGEIIFFQAEDGIRDIGVTGVQTCALPIRSEERRDEGEDRVDAALVPPGDTLHRVVVPLLGRALEADGVALGSPEEGEERLREPLVRERG